MRLQDFNSDLEPEPLPCNEPRHLGTYSLSRAIRAMAQDGKLDGIEGETHQELARRGGRVRDATGFFLPWNLQTRALTTSTGTGGITTVLGPLIDILRAKLVTANLGAAVLDDLRRGKFALPRKTGTVSVGWLDELATPTPTVPQIAEQVLFTPHTTGAMVQVSRTALISIPEAEEIIIDDLLGAIAVEIDRVALNGAGANFEPLGVLKNTDVPTVALGTDGGAPTRAAVLAMEQALGNANADRGSLGWVGSPNTRAAMRAVSIGGGSYLWGDNGRILEYPAVATANVPSDLTKGAGTNLSALILGNWRDLVIGLWGPAWIGVNPFKYATSGFVEITALQDGDVNLRHAPSFVACSDIATS